MTSPPDIGKATHFSIQEGGIWYSWKEERGYLVFAIKFESGWIWDSKVGWRPGIQDKTEKPDVS